MEDLKEKNDKKFLIIKTEDLICPKKSIKSVFKWLDLEEEDIFK